MRVWAQKNRGVFLGLVDFVCDFDSSFQAYINSINLYKGVLKTIQNELLVSILEVSKVKIKAEVQNADFFAVMCDETIDVSHKSQMIITLRYKLCGKPVERFWFF